MTAGGATIRDVPRRVIVTKHALHRARNRYNLPHLTPTFIRDDVEQAVAAGREGLRPPREISEYGGGLRARREKIRYAWTEDLARCYTVKRIRDERNGHEPALIVLTAIQGRGR